MNHELVKQLKDAGFPKNDFEWDEGIPSLPIVPGVSVPGDPTRWRNVPTLEELIEACGIYFKSLHFYLNQKWGAKHEDGREFIDSTPTEAVARLWLALRKK